MTKKLSFVSFFVALAVMFSACEKEGVSSAEEANEVVSVVKNAGDGGVLYTVEPINPNVFAKFSEPFNNGSIAVTDWATITREDNGNGPVFIQFADELPAGKLQVPVRYKESNNAIWVFSTPAVAGMKIYFEEDAAWGPVTQIRLGGVAFDEDVEEPKDPKDCDKGKGKGDDDDQGEDDDDQGEDDDDQGEDGDDQGEDGDDQGNPAAGNCAVCGKKDQGCTFRNGSWNCQSGGGTGSGGNDNQQ